LSLFKSHHLENICVKAIALLNLDIWNNKFIERHNDKLASSHVGT